MTREEMKAKYKDSPWDRLGTPWARSFEFLEATCEIARVVRSNGDCGLDDAGLAKVIDTELASLNPSGAETALVTIKVMIDIMQHGHVKKEKDVIDEEIAKATPKLRRFNLES